MKNKNPGHPPNHQPTHQGARKLKMGWQANFCLQNSLWESTLLKGVPKMPLVFLSMSTNIVNKNQHKKCDKHK